MCQTETQPEEDDKPEPFKLVMPEEPYAYKNKYHTSEGKRHAPKSASDAMPRVPSDGPKIAVKDAF